MRIRIGIMGTDVLYPRISISSLGGEGAETNHNQFGVSDLMRPVVYSECYQNRSAKQWAEDCADKLQGGKALFGLRIFVGVEPLGCGFVVVGTAQQ